MFTARENDPSSQYGVLLTKKFSREFNFASREKSIFRGNLILRISIKQTFRGNLILQIVRLHILLIKNYHALG